MGDFIKDWWEVMAGVTTVVSMLGATVYKWIAKNRRELGRLRYRIGEVENAHERHEDICGQRWAAMRDSTLALIQRLDERHADIVRLRDQQHGDNLARFDKQDKRFDRQDWMLQELLQRNDLRRRPRTTEGESTT